MIKRLYFLGRVLTNKDDTYEILVNKANINFLPPNTREEGSIRLVTVDEHITLPIDKLIYVWSAELDTDTKNVKVVTFTELEISNQTKVSMPVAGNKLSENVKLAILDKSMAPCHLNLTE